MFVKIFTFFLITSCSLDAATRIENEYKLIIPAQKTSEVWKYLTNTFPLSLKAGFEATASIEYFTDIYFDTPEFILLNKQNSLRKRIRYMPEDPKHKKNGRSLVQFKIASGETNVISRYEIKLQIKEKFKNAYVGTNPQFLLINKDKVTYNQTLEKLGIKNNDLRLVLILDQKRNRLYISYKGRPFATLSMDKARSTKWWINEEFSELEIELNENLYTESTFDQRILMQKTSDEIKKVIQTDLNYLKLDLTPKYNKMFNQLIKGRAWYPGLITVESWLH